MGDEGTEWSESHELRGQSGGDDGRQDEWQGWGDEQRCDDDHGCAMDTDEWWDTPSRRWGGGAARWQASGHGHWTKASWADQLEDERGTAHDDDGQPPTARRRLDAEGGDQPTREEQAQGQQQLQQPTQHHAGADGPGGVAAGVDQEELKRQHSARVNRIVEMAVEAGVTPLTKRGEDLIVLGPSQLEAWVKECLPSALLC